MPGTITFRPVEANLTHDTDWLGKMDPYCLFTVGSQKAKSQVCRHGGKRPHWEDTVTVQAEGNQSICRVDVMDKDKLRPDDSIASAEINLNEIQNSGRVSRWYPVYHRKRLAGEILIEANYQPTEQMIQQPIMTQPIIPATVIPTQQTFVEEKIITSAPIVTSTSNYTEFNQGLPLDTGLGLGLGQRQFGGSYEIPTTSLGTQGLPLGGQFLGGQLPIGQTFESSTFINQSSFGQGLNLGGLGLSGSQLPSSQSFGGFQQGFSGSQQGLGSLGGLGGLQQGFSGSQQGFSGSQQGFGGSQQGPGFEGSTRGYYNAGSPAYANNNLTGTPGFTGTDPALTGGNYGTSGNSGLLASKTSAFGPSGGFPHGYKTLRGATNAGYSEKPGYTLGDIESNPTTQANLDTNGGGFFNKPGRERRAEPYALSNPGTYGIPHGQTIDTAGHLRPEVALNRQAPIGQINRPGITGYPDGFNSNLNSQSRPGMNQTDPYLQSGLQSGLQSSFQPGLQSGFQSGLQPGLQSGTQSGFSTSGLGSNLQPNLGSNLGGSFQPNLGGSLQPNLGGNLQPNLSQGGSFQPNLGQGGLSGSRNNIF